MKEIKVNDKSFFVCENNIQDHINHWNWVNNGSWEPRTFEIFNNFLDTNHSYIDLGAWIGSTVLYGSQIARYTYAVEPDPVALVFLKNNISANTELRDKITLYEGVISDKNGAVRLGVKGGADLGNSVSSILATKKTVEVDSITFDTFIGRYDIEDCNFIKMDIEGAETVVLSTMKEYLANNKPVLYISLHPWTFNDKNKEDMKQIFSLYQNYYDAITNKPIKLNEVLNKREVLCL